MAQLKSLIVSGATRLIGKMFAQDIQAESVVVAADPTQNLQVATKQYVDNTVISRGGEINQNAFSNVKVGSTTVAADTKTDTLELVAGTNVTLTPDATNDKITITATDTTYTAASATPLMDGTAAVGTSTKYAREDHVHPSDTTKVDKVSGKGLSTNDYTTTEKNKLAGIAAGAEVNVQSDWNVTDTSSDAFIKNKPTIPTVPRAATATPKMDGTAAVGSSTKYAKEDHVHPSDTNKVDKVSGKGLSTNDYTTTEKNKLSGIAEGAEVNVQSDWNVTDTSSDAFIKNKPTIPTDTWKSFYGTCTTAAATKDKVVTVSSDQNFSLSVGIIVGVKFSYTNTYSNATASPITLNVNGTGAKNIWYDTTHSGGGNTGASTQIYGTANRYTWYMYDGTYWVWIHYGVVSNSNTVPSAQCETAAATAAKAATCTYFALRTNCYLHFNIRYANTSATALTMNVNSTGAKAIYINGTASSTSNYTLPAGSYIAFYNGTYWDFRTDGKLPGITAISGTNDNTLATTAFVHDAVSSSGVSGVKGDSESTYRTGDVNITKANIGLGSVENKSSATIRGELTKSNVTTALGYTPYTPAEVDALVSAVFHYKGTKATYAEVAALTGMKTGDVWQVTADNSEYVYNGSAWEKLGPTIDLSGYLTSVSVAGQTLTPGSNSITVTQLKTALGLGDAAYKDVETVLANDAKLPTGAAVKSFVEGKGYTTNTGTITGITMNGASKGTSGVVDLGTVATTDTNTRRAFYGTCATAAATKDKVVTLSNTTGWELLPGTIVGVKFTYTNTYASATTSPITLNVNSTGAKNIWYNNTHSGAGNTGTNTTIYGFANRINYYMYDGTYWVWLSFSLSANDNTVPTAYCTTAAGTAAKTASCTNYNLLAKSYTILLISTTNTKASALTLNINSKGAKPIYINGSASSASNYTMPAGSYLVYYDGTNYYIRTDGKITGDITGDAATVGGHTVGVNVPSGAVFTDTQSDWSVTDSSSKAFIKNKPTIPTIESHFTVSLASSSWSSSTTTVNGTPYYTASVTASSLVKEYPIISCGSSGTLPSSQEKNAFNLIDYAIANVTNHTITFYAIIKPTINLTINVVG